MATTPSDCRTPAETHALILKAGEAKYKDNQIIQFFKAVFGGILLSFGSTVTLVAGASQDLQSGDSGLGRIVGGAFGIPFGLIMIVLQGQELVTSTMMTVAISTVMRRTPVWYYPVIITIQFFGNLVGALMYTAIILHWGGTVNSGYFATWVQSFATTKVVTPTAAQIFVRGIGCNALVCLAVWQGTQARETISKIFAIFIPIFLFVSSAYDHVVANMCLIPIALLQGSTTITTAQYIYKSMLPSLAGNIIGALVIGLPYTVFYLSPWGSGLTTPGVMHDEARAEKTPNDLESQHTRVDSHDNGIETISHTHKPVKSAH